MKRPFAVIGLTAFLTAAATFKMEIRATASALAVFIVALLIALSVERLRKNGTVPLAAAAGALTCLLLLGETLFTYYPALNYSGKVCRARLTIVSDARPAYGKCYYQARLDEADGEKVGIKVRLVFLNPLQIEPYDRMEGVFRFFVLGDSDEELLHSNKAKGVFLGAYPTDADVRTVKIPESEKPFAKKILDARKAIKNAIFRAAPNEDGALAAALILGDKSGLSDRTLRNFNRAGISHIICVSGLHLSLWSALLLMILRKIGLGERAANLLAAAGTVAFMFVAGLTYSVVRSGLMTLVFLFGNIALRRRDALNSLGFALTVIAVFNPFAMGSTGLQLSALSTLGVILCSTDVLPEIRKFFSGFKFKTLSSFAEKAVSAFAITGAANFFTSPLTLRFYGGFNFMILISNLVVIPLAGICMQLCALGAAFGALLPGVFNLPAFVGGGIARAITFLARRLAGAEYFNFPFDCEAADIIVIALTFSALGASALVGFGKLKTAAASGLCAAIFASSVCAFSLYQRTETRFRIIDCGNGTSVFVSRGGENLLIGCGGDGFFARRDLTREAGRLGGGLDAVFIPDSEGPSSAFLNDVLSLRRPASIYFDDLPSGSELLLGGVEKRDFSENYFGKNFSVRSYEYKNNRCVYIKNKDVDALVCFGPGFDFSAVEGAPNSADLLIFRSEPPLGAGSFALTVVNAGDGAEKRFCREGPDLFGTRLASERNTAVTARRGKLRVKNAD